MDTRTGNYLEGRVLGEFLGNIHFSGKSEDIVLNLFQHGCRFCFPREAGVEIIVCKLTQKADIFPARLAPQCQEFIIVLFQDLAAVPFFRGDLQSLDVSPLNPFLFPGCPDILPELTGWV